MGTTTATVFLLWTAVRNVLMDNGIAVAGVGRQYYQRCTP